MRSMPDASATAFKPGPACGPSNTGITTASASTVAGEAVDGVKVGTEFLL